MLQNPMLNRQAAISALQWHIENGADEALEDMPVDATIMPEIPKRKEALASLPVQAAQQQQEVPFLGASDARKESLRLAKEAQTIDDLKNTIAAFDGISLKKTATNFVFGDGNPEAQIMLIGDAPGADEDRAGKAFAGAAGQLLDKILASIELDRQSVYLTNILNWRPPGNRTPSPEEIEVSLPFIEKHIVLVAPKLLIFTGGVAAKILLNKNAGISRLRGSFQEYIPLTSDLFDSAPEAIPAMATHHPASLLITPSQKKAVWQDMLMFQKKCKDIGL